MSSIADLKPIFTPSSEAEEPPQIQSVIKILNLEPHVEGGYFIETDRASDTVSTPFPFEKSSTFDIAPQRPGFDPAVRNSSTSIYYFLTPKGPRGGSHLNKGRTIHTLHKGRGRYVLIHANEDGKEKRIETFVVGHNIEKGEKF